MRYRLLQWLACPACGEEDLRLETTKADNDATFSGSWTALEGDDRGLDLDERRLVEILEGALHCPACGAIYPIRDGIPRMLPQGYSGAQASGHKWTSFDGSLPEYEDNFLDMAHPLRPSDYLGKVVLDAGCGFGRHAFFAARYGAEVVALDNSDQAVASARRNTAASQRVHVVQGDVQRPPFRQSVFDLVYSFGVLHHLAQPEQAFSALSSLVRSGGRLQLWVYGPRAGSAAIASGALRGAAANMNDETLHRFSATIARALRVFSHTPYRFLRGIPVVGSVVSHLPTHDHHQWPFEVVVADVYDRLRIPVLQVFPGERLEIWLTEAGYADVRVSRRVRNSESFRAIGTKR